MDEQPGPVLCWESIRDTIPDRPESPRDLPRNSATRPAVWVPSASIPRVIEPDKLAG
jgi:hypothetical protein